MSKWFWHESDFKRGRECDFERRRLGTAFNALGLNAKPRYQDDGNLADGDNECFSITHQDKIDKTPVNKQKYKVDGKQYAVSAMRDQRPCGL